MAEETHNEADEKKAAETATGTATETAGQEKEVDEKAPKTAKEKPESGNEALYEEINLLGARFTDLIQTAWQSDERKRIEAELKKGAASIGAAVEDTFQRISDTSKAPEAVRRVDDAVTNVGDELRAKDITNDLSAGLAKGLHKFNQQLGKWIADMEADNAAAAQASDAADKDDAQEISIEEA
ncbi:MAG: hypothetical protein KDD92_16920 [Caldilineaceae bacterium]|nr:hypothetical protein [Caldilineaceae bacterium]